MARVAARDGRALEGLYGRYGVVLRVLAFRILRNHPEAEDVVQDVYLEVWRHAGQYSPARGRPLGWLITLARRKAIDQLRRKRCLERVLERVRSSGDTVRAEGGWGAGGWGRRSGYFRGGEEPIGGNGSVSERAGADAGEGDAGSHAETHAQVHGGAHAGLGPRESGGGGGDWPDGQGVERRFDPIPACHWVFSGGGGGAGTAGVEQEEVRRILREQLAVLPCGQREALELAYLGGMSQREIARSTGVPLGTVKTRIELGRRKLCEALREIHGELCG